MRRRRAPSARGDTGGPGDVAARARAAFRAGLADATRDLTQMTDLYVAWAQRAGSPSEKAESAWMRSVVTARESMRRELPAERLRVLAGSQHAAAEAGYQLARDGRLTTAVRAAEHGRGIELTRLTGRLDPQIRARLLDAGRWPGRSGEFLPGCPAEPG